MKTLMLAVAALLCFASVSPAEVFIYKNKLKYTVTGGGGTEKTSAAGWTIINEFGDVVQVLAFTAQKRYSIVPLESITYDTADAGQGKRYSFFVQHDVWTDGSGLQHIDTGGAKGLNSTMNINGTLWDIPKSFTWSGRSSYPASSSGNMRFEESSGTFSFDKAQTATSNTQGNDINSAAQRLATVLEQQGYISYTEEL